MDRWNAIFAGFCISLLAMGGSLFFSEVLHYAPCVLCWYQRMCLFPLPIILMIGFLLKDQNVVKYAWPFVGVGLAIACYHNLLYYGVIPESLSPCTEGSSCTTVHINWFGFITIPLLSLAAFLFCGASLIGFHVLNSKGVHETR